MAEQVFLAIDLGASGGRVLAGQFDGQRLALDEVHRFENYPVLAAGSLHWDVLGLWTQIQRGLRQAAARYPGQIVSLGVDTWGVDFALLGRGDTLLGNPYAYRDRRTQGMFAATFERVPREDVFAHTGLQFMEFNTLYQLVAMRRQQSPLLDAAETLLMIPDLFHWLLTGVKGVEFTNATTTQFFNPARHAWATELFDRLDLPAHILGPILEPGTDLGPLRPEVAAETNLAGVRVVLPGTHDTASAVMAVPAASRPGARPDWCYLSSGTWSLLGAEVPAPVVSPECLQLGFTNEGGIGRTIRLLKNITGLWLVQECRRVWAQRGRDFSWDELARLAAAAPPRVSLVDPDDPAFAAPTDMPEAIRQFCRRTKQPVPESEGAVIRTALDSLALKCRVILGRLERLVGGRLETMHLVGGGVQNAALCQATADACGRRALAGPVEATALGNVLVQAIAAGAVADVAQARELVRRSFPLTEYAPRDADDWDAAAARFERLLG